MVWQIYLGFDAMSCPFQTRVSGWYFEATQPAAVSLDMITLQHACCVSGHAV